MNKTRICTLCRDKLVTHCKTFPVWAPLLCFECGSTSNKGINAYSRVFYETEINCNGCSFVVFFSHHDLQNKLVSKCAYFDSSKLMLWISFLTMGNSFLVIF